MKRNASIGMAYLYTMLVVTAILVLSSCTSRSQREEEWRKTESVTVSTDPLNSKFLGRVGTGNRGDFSLFKFEVDGVTYIVASEYGGGMTLVDKIRQ